MRGRLGEQAFEARIEGTFQLEDNARCALLAHAWDLLHKRDILRGNSVRQRAREVAAAAVLSRPRGVGTVDVVVSTPAGVPDSALLAQLSSYFTQRREIAVDVRVRAPEVKSIDVSVAVAAADGADGEAVRSRVDLCVMIM